MLLNKGEHGRAHWCLTTHRHAGDALLSKLLRVLRSPASTVLCTLQVVLHAVDSLVASSSNNVLRNGYEKVKPCSCCWPQHLKCCIVVPAASTSSGLADALCMIHHVTSRASERQELVTQTHCFSISPPYAKEAT